MELGQLEAFLQVVETQSFSRAAEVLELTQPSLSARILSLEREVGEPLFHRMGRGVRPTDAGWSFLPYVQRALEALREGRETLDASHSASQGRLLIGAGRALGTYVLPEILDVFHLRHAGIDIGIRTGHSSQILEMVLSEQVQVGLGRALVHPEIHSHYLYDEHLVLTTSPEHPFALRHGASIYDVATEPLILYDRDSSFFLLINRICREAGIVPSIQMDLDSVEATKRMIERGLGISFLPHNSIRREVELGTLVEVPLRDEPDVVHVSEVSVPMASMLRRAKSYSAIVITFLNLLQELYPSEGRDVHVLPLRMG